MAPEAQEPISEITEISDDNGLARIIAFVSAMGWGTLAGTVSVLASNALLDPEGMDLGGLAAGAAFLGIFVGLFTLAGMILIGLPVTLLLRVLDVEFAWLYAALGAIAGFIVIALFIGLPWIYDHPYFGFMVSGGLAGFTSAYRWGRWRVRVAKARQAERENLAAQRRTNPIHELIH